MWWNGRNSCQIKSWSTLRSSMVVPFAIQRPKFFGTIWRGDKLIVSFSTWNNSEERRISNHETEIDNTSTSITLLCVHSCLHFDARHASDLYAWLSVRGVVFFLDLFRDINDVSFKSDLLDLITRVVIFWFVQATLIISTTLVSGSLLRAAKEKVKLRSSWR